MRSILIGFFSLILLCSINCQEEITAVFDSVRVQINEVFSISVDGKEWIFDGELNEKNTYKFIESHPSESSDVFLIKVLKKDVFYFRFIKQNLKSGESEERIIEVISDETKKPSTKIVKPREQVEVKPQDAPKQEDSKQSAPAPAKPNEFEKVAPPKAEKGEFDELNSYVAIEKKIKEIYAIKDPKERNQKLVRLADTVPYYDKLDQILYDIAIYYESQSDIANALKYFKQVVKNYPLSQFEKTSLGKIYYYDRFFYLD